MPIQNNNTPADTNEAAGAPTTNPKFPIQSSRTREELALTPQQIAELESEDQYLRGTAALEIVNDAIRKTGVYIPPHYVFKDRKNTTVNKAMHAAFELLGGVPGLIAWAASDPKHLGQFYTLYAKQAAPDLTINSGGNVVIQTAVPESALDTIEVDEQGRVIDADD